MIRRAALLVPGLLAATAAGCTFLSPGPSTPPGYLTVLITSSPNNLDPRIGTDEVSQRVSQLIFDPLLNLDDSLRVVPGLADRWETPDPTTCVVSLRHAIHFQDGRELTSADVVDTFQRFLDPSFISGRKGAYSMLASVRALDRYTVEFRLKEPFGSFPVNLVMPIVPAGAGPDFKDHPIGTGPYSLVGYTTDDRVVLKANPDYWGGPPRNAGLVLKVVPDDTMRGLELKKGSADLVVNDLSPDLVVQLQEDPDLQVVTSPGTNYAYVGMNLRDPILRHVRVRQAIGYAIDRDAIVRYLRRGLARPAVGILPPASWAFDPDVFAFTFDPAKAKRLLDEAGLPDPDGDGPRPRFHLSLKVSNSEFYRLQATVIQQDLARVGIAVDIRTYEFATLYADVLHGAFQLFTMQWVGVSDPDMLRRVFASSQVPPSGFNRGYFRDPEVDRLIRQATVSTDEATRRQLYARVQAIVARQAPYISLWYQTNAVVAQADLRGIHPDPRGGFAFLRDVFRAPAPAAASH
ncbi:MAG: ABC transporter substrate-binding protein [Acidobacteriota bacterium]|nr:ABC transporter substrate-binding protein [Acidobacteriota bacterium]